MSDINNKTEAISKNMELVVSTRDGAISENLWIIGVSKTHPGLKYYFNTVTGVSLWNISREDMERAKNTMRASGNQPQYANCPEPMEPPPIKRSCVNPLTPAYCEHVPGQSKNNSRLARDASGFICDICYASINTPSNVITVNFRQCPHLAYNSPLNNACTSSQSFNQFQSSPAVSDTTVLENNHCYKTINNLLGNNGSLNRKVAEIRVHDSSSEQLPSQSNIDSDSFQCSTSHESLDLTLLKMFARNGVRKDKWYIIADTDVYLNHITLLKSVLTSDNECSLMVPKNVEIELDNATKSKVRTKAHYASYYIYKMFDSGFARIDEDSSTLVHDKSNEEHVLDCCSKLKEENFYVVVISNDIELQKYRNKIYIPIFTVAELKEYLNKNNSTESPKQPKERRNFEVFPPNNQSMPSSKLPFTHTSILSNSDITIERNKNVRASFTCNDIGTQVEEFGSVFKGTDVEIQTDYNPVQFQEAKNICKEMHAPNQTSDISKRKDISIANMQSYENPLHTCNIQGSSKRIKLRRKKVLYQSESNSPTNLVNLSERIEINNTKDVSPSKYVNQYKNVSNISNNMIAAETTTKTLKQKDNAGVTMRKSNRAFKSKSHKENFENKNVMFEITTEMMDHNLRNKCDEWVSRFVQIMEEALTQILAKHSSLYLPPPWNMYEAATCIEKRFTNDEDVADASRKFLNILNRICDEKGNINANISPTEYMEMYSFGVYIIDALQGIFSSCDDLQSAAESLSKLLVDIQDPDSDVRNLEQFHSISLEDKLINGIDSSNDNVEVFMIIETKSLPDDMSIENTECLPNLTDAGTSCNDASNNNTTTNNNISNENDASKIHNRLSANVESGNEKSQADKNIICTEMTSGCNTFSVASPRRHNLEIRPIVMPSEKQDNQYLSKEDMVVKNYVFKRTLNSNTSIQKNIVKGKPENFDDSSDKNITAEKNSDDVQPLFSNRASEVTHKVITNTSEPKIVRNFVTCAEFEDRLATKQLYDDMDELDYEDELIAENYIDEDEASRDTGQFEIDEYPEFNYNQSMEVETTKNTGIVKIDFKYFITTIAQEIQELSFEVYTFSQNASEEFNILSNQDDKSEIREKAEQIHFTIDKLCTALTNILNRDKNGGYNMQALLKQAGFDDITIKENDMKTYRSFITRCLEQAHDLETIIKDILSAVC